MTVAPLSRCILILSRLCLLLIAGTAQAQDRPQVTPNPAPQNVAPLTTRVMLNGAQLDYGTAAATDFGATLGDSRRTQPLLNFTDPLAETLTETTSTNVFHRRQTGRYLQVRSVLDRQEITAVRTEAVDLIGQSTLLTITGRCLLPGTDPDAYCSYTPGVSTDPAQIDPDTLVPTGFDTGSAFGAGIDAATHDALKAPGFQQTGPDGTPIGLRIDLPNAGLTYATDRPDLNRVTRTEDTRVHPVLSYADVVQNLYSTDTAAALDRTIRGGVLLPRADWSPETTVLQALAFILPAPQAQSQPALQGGGGAPQLSISNNLFYAANNIRLPDAGLTMYQSTWAWGPHALTPPTRAAETPVAWARSIWFGVSPVSTLTRSTALRYVTTGDRLTVRDTFAQGGLTAEGVPDIGGQIVVLDLLTDDLQSIDITRIEDLFVQTGGRLTTQEAIRRVTTTETTDYAYVPHIALSGNRTDGTSVLRYYTGAILMESTDLYAGFDYVLNRETGLQAGVGAMLHSAPTRDHYSLAQASLSQRLTLETAQLTLGVAASTEFDRPDVADLPDADRQGDTLVDLIASYRDGPGTLTLRQRATNIGRDDRADSTTLGFALQVSPALSATAEVTPASTEDSYFVARAGLGYQMAGGPAAPRLAVQWARIRYDYGTDNVGGALSDTENTLLATLRMTF